ncbi:MAG: formate--tetrahydrofolate ligase, partial [Thermoplasmata archaeon]|nr:formate--tetrahydrofolate ligase [Thermoplasmata archaeon]
MKSDLEIARETELMPVADVASSIGIRESEIIPWGRYKAKVSLDIFNRIKS